MSRPFPIPDQEQLRALSGGLKAVFQLLSEYLGDLNSVPDFRRHITVSKEQLAIYLRTHPELAQQHIGDPDAPKYHELPVLERNGTSYRVYEVDHDRAWNVMEFTDLADAAAEYLMWGWWK